MNPVDELKLLRNRFETTELGEISGSINLTSNEIPVQQSEWVIEAELTDEKTEKLYLQFSNAANEIYRIGYDIKKQQYFSDRTKAGNHSFSDKFGIAVHTAPRLIKSKRIKLHLFVDASSVELFADGGAMCMTELLFPTKPFNQIQLVSNGGAVKIISAKGYSMKGIWK
jgi:sucrose-6-phosphate hydrolase SacC (GH32 family)